MYVKQAGFQTAAQIKNNLKEPRRLKKDPLTQTSINSFFVKSPEGNNKHPTGQRETTATCTSSAETSVNSPKEIEMENRSESDRPVTIKMEPMDYSEDSPSTEEQNSHQNEEAPVKNEPHSESSDNDTDAASEDEEEEPTTKTDKPKSTSPASKLLSSVKQGKNLDEYESVKNEPTSEHSGNDTNTPSEDEEDESTTTTDRNRQSSVQRFEKRKRRPSSKVDSKNTHKIVSVKNEPESEPSDDENEETTSDNFHSRPIHHASKRKRSSSPTFETDRNLVKDEPDSEKSGNDTDITSEDEMECENIQVIGDETKFTEYQKENDSNTVMKNISERIRFDEKNDPDPSCSYTQVANHHYNHESRAPESESLNIDDPSSKYTVQTDYTDIDMLSVADSVEKISKPDEMEVVRDRFSSTILPKESHLENAREIKYNDDGDEIFIENYDVMVDLIQQYKKKEEEEMEQEYELLEAEHKKLNEAPTANAEKKREVLEQLQKLLKKMKERMELNALEKIDRKDEKHEEDLDTCLRTNFGEFFNPEKWDNVIKQKPASPSNDDQKKFSSDADVDTDTERKRISYVDFMGIKKFKQDRAKSAVVKNLNKLAKTHPLPEGHARLVRKQKESIRDVIWECLKPYGLTAQDVQAITKELTHRHVEREDYSK